MVTTFHRAVDVIWEFTSVLRSHCRSPSWSWRGILDCLSELLRCTVQFSIIKCCQEVQDFVARERLPLRREGAQNLRIFPANWNSFPEEISSQCTFEDESQIKTTGIIPMSSMCAYSLLYMFACVIVDMYMPRYSSCEHRKMIVSICICVDLGGYHQCVSEF